MQLEGITVKTTWPEVILTSGQLPAERGGFEPPVPVDPVRQFSKLLV